MLPIPVKKFIPKIFHDDPRIDNFAQSIEDDIVEWSKETNDLHRQMRPDECDAKFLPLLDFLLQANVQPFDDERTKRRKITDAISTHKKRGRWEADAKIRIDNITGLSPGSRIITSQNGDDWILVGDGLTPSTSYWATMGADGIDNNLGLALIGSGDEIEIAGNIYIDLHEGINTAILSATTIDKIKQELEDDVAPAYMRLFLGYINVSGQFVEYPNGRIE